MSYILHVQPVFNNVNLKSHILSVWTYKYKKNKKPACKLLYEIKSA